MRLDVLGLRWKVFEFSLGCLGWFFYLSRGLFFCDLMYLVIFFDGLGKVGLNIVGVIEVWNWGYKRNRWVFFV